MPDVIMPNSLLLPAAASEKSERDTPAAIPAEGSGKYSGTQAWAQVLQKTRSGARMCGDVPGSLLSKFFGLFIYLRKEKMRGEETTVVFPRATFSKAH